MQLTEKNLLRDIGQAIKTYDLIADGDRILVAVSGGKDSYAMLHLLHKLKKKAPISFDLIAVHLDQGQPRYNGTPLVEWLTQQNYPHQIVREDTYSIVIDKTSEGKTYCSMCSRLRRGILYRIAHEQNCNKIALGHHRDDAIETLFLNLFFAGKMAAMPAFLKSEHEHATIIRPLINCQEQDLSTYAQDMRFPILPCNLCGSQEQAKRKQIKSWIANLSTTHPNIQASLFAALQNVQPSHLLDPNIQRKQIKPNTVISKRKTLRIVTHNQEEETCIPFTI